MASQRRIELLLTNTVDNLGIVGDVVRVRTGYARNYLIPMGLAELPTPEKIKALQSQRDEALKSLAARKETEQGLAEQLEGVALTMTRSANDYGVLYGSVTQRDIADSLAENGFDVNTRAVRLHEAIRRIGEYPVTIQFDKDLRVDIEVVVNPDRPLEERDEMEFDEEGNLIIKQTPAPEVAAEAPATEAVAAEEGTAG
jgi:large subunit ribosomal protein L9